MGPIRAVTHYGLRQVSERRLYVFPALGLLLSVLSSFGIKISLEAFPVLGQDPIYFTLTGFAMGVPIKMSIVLVALVITDTCLSKSNL